MNHFNVSNLPSVLVESILQWIQDHEAHQLLQVNKNTRTFIQKRGIFPKQVSQIKLCITYTSGEESYLMGEDENEQRAGFAFEVIVDPKRYTGNLVNKEWIIPFNPCKSTQFLWKQLNKVRSCRQFCINFINNGPNINDLSGFLEDHPIFPSLHHIERFALQGDPHLIQIILPFIKPITVDHLEAFPFESESSMFFGTSIYHTDNWNAFADEIFKQKSLQNLKWLSRCLMESHLPQLRQININTRHIEFNCFNARTIECALEDFLQHGIPSKDPKMSTQIRDYLFKQDNSIDFYYQHFFRVISSNPNVKSLKKEEISEKEFSLLKYLRHRSSRKFNWEMDPSSNDWKGWENESDTEKLQAQYFLQTNEDREVILFYSVDERAIRGSEFEEVAINIIWIPRFESRLINKI